MRIYTREQVELVRVQFFDVVNHIPKSKRVSSIALEDSHFTCKYNHKLVCEYVHNCFIQYMVKPINWKKSVRTMMSIKREEFGKNPGKKGVNRKGLSRQIKPISELIEIVVWVCKDCLKPKKKKKKDEG